MTDTADPTAASYDPPLTRCPACEAARIAAVDRDFRGHAIWRCARCGTRFMNPQYSDRHLRDYYASYITQDSPERIAYRRGQKELHLKALALYQNGGRCLCVGCGDGLELRVARELGFAAEGCDVDPATTRRVAEAVGAPVHAGFLPDLALPDAAFDCLYLDQVLEHVKSLRPYLESARRLLKPGGALYIGLPNIGSLSCRIKTLLGRMGLKRKSRGRHYGTLHHHLYFAPGPFAALLRRDYGFEVLRVSGDPAPGAGGLKAAVERRFPILGSTFMVIARKPAP